MSLIEVLAGLAIAGTLLVSILTAKRGYVRQWNEAHRRQDVVRALDAQLISWWTSPKGVPRNGSGPLLPGATWRVREVQSETAEQLDAQIVRVEVLDRGRGSDQWDEPLLYVDLLLERIETNGAGSE